MSYQNKEKNNKYMKDYYLSHSEYRKQTIKRTKKSGLYKGKHSRKIFTLISERFGGDIRYRIRCIIKPDGTFQNKGAIEIRYPPFQILNTSFQGGELHHLTEDVGVFIPKKLHQNNRHIRETDEGMDIINGKVLIWAGK